MTEQGGTNQAEHVVKGKWSPGEVVDSLTGPEEDAVVEVFGAEVAVLMLERRPTKARRALLYVLNRRDGKSPAEAQKAANDLRAGEVFEFFMEIDDSASGEDSESPSGNDESGPVSEQTSTRGSASASDSTPASTTP